MQPDPNIQTTDAQQKTPFWQNKDRRITFLVGVGLVILATVFMLVISSWKEAPVVEVGQGSYSCKNSSDRSYALFYDVDGKRYSITACAPRPLSTVTYYPGDPGIALINQMVVYKVIAIVIGVLGGFLMLGAAFATNVKESQSINEVNNQPMPTQVPESIMPTMQSIDSSHPQKRIARRIFALSIIVLVVMNNLIKLAPDNDTFISTIAGIINGASLCALLVSAIILNNILRRERKDVGIGGEPRPLTIEESFVKVVIYVAIGLGIIAAAIFALAFFYGNSK